MMSKVFSLLVWCKKKRDRSLSPGLVWLGTTPVRGRSLGTSSRYRRRVADLATETQTRSNSHTREEVLLCCLVSDTGWERGRKPDAHLVLIQLSRFLLSYIPGEGEQSWFDCESEAAWPLTWDQVTGFWRCCKNLVMVRRLAQGASCLADGRSGLVWVRFRSVVNNIEPHHALGQPHRTGSVIGTLDAFPVAKRWTVRVRAIVPHHPAPVHTLKRDRRRLPPSSRTTSSQVYR